jgi:hypothetical protein
MLGYKRSGVSLQLQHQHQLRRTVSLKHGYKGPFGYHIKQPTIIAKNRPSSIEPIGLAPVTTRGNSQFMHASREDLPDLIFLSRS